MGYYMRFISIDDTEITRSVLEQVLQQRDLRYSITEAGEIKHGDDIYGLVEINLLGEELFEEELLELKEDVEDVRGKRQSDVLKTLDEAKAIVAVQVLWQGRETEPTLQKLDPMWEWLLTHRKGLQQADGEGYYDHSGHILKVE